MKVSVIIPAYNAEQTLDLCLNSLSEQNYPKDQYEIIVVNDGSTDTTPEQARRPGVMLISQDNQGPAAARNAGASVARGDIILFTDSDCVPTHNWITEMTAPFQQHDVAAVKGAYKTKQKEIIARFAQIEFEERFDQLEKVGYTDMVDTYSAGYRTKLFKDMKGFDTRFPVANNEDTELSYRMAAANLKMVFTPKAIVYHLDHPNSLVRYTKLKFGRGYWRMVVYKKFPEKAIKDTYTPQSLKLQIIALFLILTAFLLSSLTVVNRTVLLLPCVLLFCFSITPFTLIALKKDRVVGLFAPLLLTVRAAALGFGAIWGFVHGRL